MLVWLCAMQYLLYQCFCQFLAIYMSAWMWCKIWRLPNDTDVTTKLIVGTMINSYFSGMTLLTANKEFCVSFISTSFFSFHIHWFQTQPYLWQGHGFRIAIPWKRLVSYSVYKIKSVLRDFQKEKLRKWEIFVENKTQIFRF